ncbi:protein C3orf33-like [Ylistrum balloti]|uniref:protein C3orf33-like n=1 Tax=Ylistrum balloti TaxID=509963 RepID=UPI002905BEA7|nr:protein C3orf33-like [Ylistrum balloti]XP_060073368.1 protein C3orf33-like [Ylistrum balloti]XP_060073369.1 protein C3orf33-like [Ylistrum balloti]
MSSGDEEHEKRHEANDFLFRITTFVDRYIREAKWVAYGVGSVGLVLVLRGIHATDVFSTAKDIPKHFIKNGVHLRGRVASFGVNGILHIDHKPLLTIKPRWLQHFYKTKSLSVELAYVSVSPLGQQWLRSNILGKKVLFQPLQIQEKSHPWEDSVVAAVYIPKVCRRKCVNEELVAQGLCKVSYDFQQDMSKLSLEQSQLLDKLIALESIASNKEKGMWKGLPSERKYTKILGAMKGIVTLPWTGLKNIAKVFGSWINRKKQ